MSQLIVCGNKCGHNHESLNGPTGCCAEHGPYMYFCGDCHDRPATPTPRTPESADERGACLAYREHGLECGLTTGHDGEHSATPDERGA